MFKALTIGAICTAVFGLRIDPAVHDDLIWSSGDNLTDEQKKWDEFFRSEIDAIGDSKVQKVSGVNNFQYLDTTPNSNDEDSDSSDDEIVAWEVNGGKDGDDWIVERVTQVKTYTDQDDENISYVTKTTYTRDNLPAIASKQYA